MVWSKSYTPGEFSVCHSSGLTSPPPVVGIYCMDVIFVHRLLSSHISYPITDGESPSPAFVWKHRKCECHQPNEMMCLCWTVLLCGELCEECRPQAHGSKHLSTWSSVDGAFGRGYGAINMWVLEMQTRSPHWHSKNFTH